MKKNLILKATGSSMNFLSPISKNDVFWPLCFSGMFRDRESWLKMSSYMVPNHELLSPHLAGFSSKVIGGGYPKLSYKFFKI